MRSLFYVTSQNNLNYLRKPFTFFIDMRLKYLPVLVLLFSACSNNGTSITGEKISHQELDTSGIDAYVKEKMDTSQIYEVKLGMRFSQEGNIAYTASSYNQNDTTILYSEEIESPTGNTYRNLFFKESLPVYVEEYITMEDANGMNFIERKTYLNGAIILKSLERSSLIEEELVNQPFKEITITKGSFDFDKPANAIAQSGDFQMRFGEFLDFNSLKYLILENEESGNNVALLINGFDSFLAELYNNPTAYQNRVVIPTFEFVTMNGMVQMVYTGGKFGD